MHKFVVAILALLGANIAVAQLDSLNMRQLGKLDYTWNLNDIWGYADSSTNKEYALVGAQDGFSVVDVTVPSNPTQKIFIGGAFSLWRDIKSWSHYAYVSHDYQFAWSTLPSLGVLIVDLDSLNTPHYRKFRPKFTLANGTEDSLATAHNLFIDEFGVMYVFGASGFAGGNLFNGGALMFDVATDPWNPNYLGRFSNYYLHDGYARDNILYGAAVNNGVFALIDVSVKTSPVILATKGTPNQFTHNCWLSDDKNTLFTTDEVSGAFIAAYDISNQANITELSKIRTLPGTGVIPHNVHVNGDFLVTSYYTRGLQIVDAEYPDLMVEVAYYDTSPLYSGNGFHGAWGAYPWLPSGNILVSDIEEGLYVLASDYKRAARLKGLVVDSLTGNTILQAKVILKMKNDSLATNVVGAFKFGFEEAGWDTLEVSKFGYYTQKVPFQFVSGNYDSLRIALLPLNFSVEENASTQFNLFPNPSNGSVTIELASTIVSKECTISIVNSLGQVIERIQVVGNTKIHFDLKLPSGLYFVNVQAEDYSTTQKLLLE